jgi:hypothetical protein
MKLVICGEAVTDDIINVFDCVRELNTVRKDVTAAPFVASTESLLRVNYGVREVRPPIALGDFVAIPSG